MREADKNFILLNRNIYKCAFWYDKPFTRAQVWIDLLMMAYWTDGKALVGNTWIPIKRGEISTSERQLMKRWGWGNTHIRGFLKMLENDGMIERRTDRQKTIIRILNYDKFQLKNKGQSAANADEIRLYQEGTTHNQSRVYTNDQSTNQSTLSIENTSVLENTQSTLQHTTTYTDEAHINNNIKKIIKNKEKEIQKRVYGEFENVLLTDEEIEKLKEQFPDSWREKIEDLSSYMASTGKKYKSHLATIRNWDRRSKGNTKGVERGANNEQRSKQRELYDTNNIFE